MNVVRNICDQPVWYKFIFHCGIDLYDIATLTTNINVMNGFFHKFWRMRFNSERMRPKEAKTIKSSLSEGSNKKQFEIRYNALSIALCFLKGFHFIPKASLYYTRQHTLWVSEQ